MVGYHQTSTTTSVFYSVLGGRFVDVTCLVQLHLAQFLSSLDGNGIMWGSKQG